MDNSNIVLYIKILKNVAYFYDNFFFDETTTYEGLQSGIDDLFEQLRCFDVDAILHEVLTRNGYSKKRREESIHHFIDETNPYVFQIPTISNRDLLGDKNHRLLSMCKTTKLSRKEIWLIGEGFHRVLSFLFWINDTIYNELCKYIRSEEKNPKRQKDFRSLIQCEEKEKLLERLHELIDCCSKSSDIAAIISKAILDNNLIRLPDEKEFRSEFKMPGTWEAIRKGLIDHEEKGNKYYEAAVKVVIFDKKHI